ncbi:Actin-binding protein IPP [Eumeta japonica]|uniref:Actin-binding protein IPP n=1 Tax=Eumeta variegata TaxID=151549 RepID=A0A4C1WIQ2_EUMVA|nr:Actin-binding protein IPP [Eumeta japonica]
MEFHDNEIVFSSKTAVAKFEECRQNLRFCDVTLQSGQVAVKAHRVVLAAASPYFEALFEDGLQEPKELVNCSDIPSDVLPTLVDFLYTGHVTFQSSTAHELMAAAHMLHLDSLITGCARYLRTQLNTSNALSMLSFAETLGCTKLTEYALDYIGEYWTVIAQRKELLELSLTTFITILSSDRFVTDNELGVIFAIVRWLEHKPAARAPHCFELVRHLRLGRVPADIMDEIWRVVRDMRVMGGLELYKMEAIANARVRSRGAFFTVKSGRISKYDVNKNVWEDLVAMDACREDHSLVALGSRVYMVGGQEGSQRLRSGEAYDLATNKWSPVASLNEGRSHFALAALKGKLYAFGGYGDNGKLHSVEVYDPRTDVWLRAGDLPQTMADLRAVTYKAVPVKNYWKTLDWEVLATRRIHQTLRRPTIISSGQWRMLCQSSGSHHMKISKNWIDSWIASKDKEFFRFRIQKLPERWKKVVASDGQYSD